MTYIIKDVEVLLRQGEFDVFAHGVNCKNSFGSGIAGILKRTMPKVKEEYHRVCTPFDSRNLLGKVTEVKVLEGKLVLNCFTQLDRGYDGAKYASYDAIDRCFLTIAENYSQRTIYYPLIGAGLGGVHWPVVKEIIDHRLDGVNHACILRQEDVIKHKIILNE